MNIFKPIRRQTFLRDFAVIQVGFALFGLSITVLIQANLGTSPWVMLTVALAQITGLTIGTMTVLIGLVVLAVSLLLREKIGWGTLGNILFIGPWVDVTHLFIPSIEDNFWGQMLMLLASILLMGLATAVYISVDAGAGPRDTLMLAVQRNSNWSLRWARGSIEVVVVLLGWLLGGPIGIGTLIFALLIGPAVQWGFRLFKVQTHKMVVPEPTADETT